MRVRNYTAVGNDRLPQRRAIHLAAGQKSRMCVNRCFGVEETVFRNEIGQVEVRFIKRADRPDVFPVALEDERVHMSIFDRLRNDVFAEILEIVVETFNEHVAIENINAHRRLKQLFVFVRSDFPQQFPALL